MTIEQIIVIIGCSIGILIGVLITVYFCVSNAKKKPSDNPPQRKSLFHHIASVILIISLLSMILCGSFSFFRNDNPDLLATALGQIFAGQTGSTVFLVSCGLFLVSGVFIAVMSNRSSRVNKQP